MAEDEATLLHDEASLDESRTRNAPHTESASSPPPSAVDPDDFTTPPPGIGIGRYAHLKHLARGGQGDVFEAYDCRLSRWVAIKVLRADRLSGEALKREVELLVDLEHPGIVPVHDRGETLDGRPWFAMQRLEGLELRDVIDAMRAGHGRWTPRRVLDLLVRVATAVGHAHQKGVVHCDLKPRNVMVGPLGEVWVMDWGIARRLPSRPVDPSRPALPSGTPGYLAPERFAGDALEPRVDVYSLGAILYTMLTGDRPGLTLAAVDRWSVRWPDGADVDEELVALAAAACAREPGRRPDDGAAFARRLTDWLDGARRRDEARVLVSEAAGLRVRWKAAKRAAHDLRREGARLLTEVGPLASDAAKRPGRQLEDQAEARAAEAAMLEVELVGAVQAALTRDAGVPGARELLAEHHRDLLLDAEAARDSTGARRAEALIRLGGSARHIEWLDSPARLSLSCRPARARITLHRYVVRDRRLATEPFRTFHHAPLDAEPVPPGSYLAVLEAPGYRAARCPLRLERGRHWQNAPPGGAPRPVRLLEHAEIEPDAVYVPAGNALVGGDPAALDGLPRRHLWIDGFVIERTSVTHRMWLVFLDAVLAARGPETLRGLLPRPRDADDGRRGPIELTDDGRLVLGFDDEDQPIHPESPVVLVDHHAAAAYARWRADRSGRPWRLPHDLEWEKAARGVDGRLWPWGDHFDPILTRVAESQRGRPSSAPVGTCPTDESPFGVRDMAGLVRNWCASDYLRDGPPGDRLDPRPGIGPLRMVRGGAWAATAGMCRPAGRFANRPDQRFRTIGVRLVRSIEG